MNCTLCGSKNHEEIFNQLEKCVTSDSEMIDGKILNKICEDCGHIFNIYGTRKFTESFYRDSYKLMDSSSNAEFKYYSNDSSINYSDWRLNILTENFSVPLSGNILDIGCGKGNFLDTFNKKFKNWNIFGIEGSKNALSFAKNKLPNSNFFEGLFSKNPFNKKFDIIVSLGVVEHLENPNEFLTEARNCLNENGIIMFDVPNFKLNPSDLYVFDHLNHFTKETLQNLIQNNELEILKIIETNDRMPLFVICKKTIEKKPLKNHFQIMNDLVSQHIKFNNSLMDTYENVNKKFDQIGIFGLGLMLWIAIQNNKISIEKISGIYDENELLINKKISGINIYHLNELINQKDLPILFSLSPCYMNNVTQKLDNLGIKYFIPNNFTYYKNYL